MVSGLQVGGKIVKLEEGEAPFTLCFRCGVCCTKYQVRLNQVEARQIADGLGISWDEFLERYVDQRWPGVESFLLRQDNGACVFLKQKEDNQSICLIHPFKPSACQEWVPSLHRRECREGLAKYWGLRVGSQGELQGEEERIYRFQLFLKSLAMGGAYADLRV
jgi:hypothetical protein